MFIDIVDVSVLILPTVPVATTSSPFWNNTSILSPIFKLDLSISLVSLIFLSLPTEKILEEEISKDNMANKKRLFHELNRKL